MDYILFQTRLPVPSLDSQGLVPTKSDLEVECPRVGPGVSVNRRRRRGNRGRRRAHGHTHPGPGDAPDVIGLSWVPGSSSLYFVVYPLGYCPTLRRESPFRKENRTLESRDTKRRHESAGISWTSTSPVLPTPPRRSLSRTLVHLVGLTSLWSSFLRRSNRSIPTPSDDPVRVKFSDTVEVHLFQPPRIFSFRPPALGPPRRVSRLSLRTWAADSSCVP